MVRLPLQRDRGLQGLLDELVPGDGSASVVAVDVTETRLAAVNADAIWYPASLYKLPLLIEALWQSENGGLDLAEVVRPGQYAGEDLGTLELLGLDSCSALSLRDALAFMTVASDNALAHLVRDLLGAERVDSDLAGMGLRYTSVRDAQLSTTAFDMALLLGALVCGYPSQQVSDVALSFLIEQWVRDRIPSGIDDPGTVIANKTGDWDGAAHDVAVVEAPFGRYVLVILTDGSYLNDFFTSVSRAVYDYLAATASVPDPQAP